MAFVKAAVMLLAVKLISFMYRKCLYMKLGGENKSNKSE